MRLFLKISDFFINSFQAWWWQNRNEEIYSIIVIVLFFIDAWTVESLPHSNIPLFNLKFHKARIYPGVESATDRHRGFFQLSERGAVPATLPLSYLLFLYVVVKCLIIVRCLRTNCAFKPFRPIVNIAKV